MTTLDTAADKHRVSATRSNAVARALLLRKLNRLLALFGRVMHSSSLVNSK
ncbi:hypothetical protein [Rheinheimera pleomorphica]|uniref:hypothetical protein n=1 Tax=Rheinheimera pleomorphica TaxID=2703963 RepID=UPI0014206767|nr:hypothetical protein [Rheinheimera pleomorphica]